MGGTLSEGAFLATGVALYAGEGSKTEGAVKFTEPYRAVADTGIRHNKHVFGCATVVYGCTRTHRLIMGSIRALLSSEAIPG